MIIGYDRHRVLEHAWTNVQFLLKVFLYVLIDSGNQNMVLVESVTYTNDGHLYITGVLAVPLILL